MKRRLQEQNQLKKSINFQRSGVATERPSERRSLATDGIEGLDH